MKKTIFTVEDLLVMLKFCSIQKTDTEINMVVTSQIAGYIINQFKFLNQRALVDSNLKNIHKSMSNGDFDFRLNSIIIAILPSGKAFLIDGNHRISVLYNNTNLGLPSLNITPTLKLKLIYCDTYDEVVSLYNKIDNGKSRTLKDKLKAYDTATSIGAKKSTDIDQIAKAIQLIISGMSKKDDINSKVLNNLIKIHSKEILNLLDILNHEDSDTDIRSFFKTIDMLAFLLIIVVEDKNNKALPFIKNIIDKTITMPYNHPCQHVRKAIIRYKGEKHQSSDKIVIFNKLGLAWGKFVDGKDLNRWDKCSIYKGENNTIVRNNIPKTRYKSPFNDSGKKIFKVINNQL